MMTAMLIIEQAIQFDGNAQLYQQTRSEVIRMRATMLKKQLHSPATTAVDNARMNQDNSIL